MTGPLLLSTAIHAALVLALLVIGRIGWPAPQTADLKPFAPQDANLVVLLRSDKLRQSPHRAGVELLLSALPDYTTLLGGTGLSPIDDLEALLIATSDPRSVIATFLAARYKDSAKLRAIANRTMPPGDPRVFRTLVPGLTVLTQPEGAARLDGAQKERTVGDAGEDPRLRWLAQLEQFDRVAAVDGGPAVLVTLSDVPALMRFGDGLPTPEVMALAATAEASPAVRLKLGFAAEADAEQFAAAWPEIVRRWRSATALFGLASALDGLQLQRAGAEVELAGRLPETQLRIALGMARALVPHHDVDGGAAPR
jgi:hypothetical protein